MGIMHFGANMSVTSDNVRNLFLEYFQERDHLLLPSSSLIPVDDPSVLFTSAGMQQFKAYYSGDKQAPHPRITTSQKCFRTSDIDEVGDSSHLTFFEMLGNFSFGDYFKRESIEWAWELLTERVGIEADLLWVTVFEGDGVLPRDEESASHWRNVGVPDERIIFRPKAENFWGPTGDRGPCGPDTEIHYRLCPPEQGHQETGPAGDPGRYLELWNLVFNEFYQDHDGSLRPLEVSGVDTGAGFERWVVLMQGKNSVYDTDLYTGIVGATVSALGLTSQSDEERALRIISEHIRAGVFLVADGVMPGNEGRGYVLRRQLRRLIGQARLIGNKDPFVATVADAAIETMSSAYPEVEARRDHILSVFTDEEERFQLTLDRGMTALDSELNNHTEGEIPGHLAFMFHDTYGVPIDLVKDIAGSRGIPVDSEGFLLAMNDQRERSREQSNVILDTMPKGLPATEFVGYQVEEKESCKIVAIFQDGDLVSSAELGDEVSIVLDSTPFYAESGGQVGDTGCIIANEFRFIVQDAKKNGEGTYFHIGRINRGSVEVGEVVSAHIDGLRRTRIRRNHTATHLLHSALRINCGEHIRQAGSFVGDEYLRFDFTQPEGLTTDMLTLIENDVNNSILQSKRAETEITEVQVAIEAGAMALFGEKYGDSVRMVRIDDTSLELCGGTHVDRTSEIGSFIVTKEENIGSGVRRIEAVTGHSAVDVARCALDVVRDVAGRLETATDEVLQRLDKVTKDNADNRRLIGELRRQVAEQQLAVVASHADNVDGITKVVTSVDVQDAETLRNICENMDGVLSDPWVFFLGAVVNNRPLFFSGASPKAVSMGINASLLVKAACLVAGGGGGGSAEMANGGGKHPKQIEAALRAVNDVINEQVG